MYVVTMPEKSGNGLVLPSKFRASFSISVVLGQSFDRVEARPILDLGNRYSELFKPVQSILGNFRGEIQFEDELFDGDAPGSRRQLDDVSRQGIIERGDPREEVDVSLGRQLHSFPYLNQIPKGSTTVLERNRFS